MKDIKLYVKSMGRVFRVRHIAQTEESANEYTRKNKDCGVMAEDRETGLVFICDFYQLPVKSDVLPD